MNIQIVPESAPFDAQQRAWLNGFLAGVIGLLDQENARGGNSASLAAAAATLIPPSGTIDSEERKSDADEEFPWHDASLDIAERMKLSEGKHKSQRLMAAMAQLDCGSCGYVCKTYAEAIAEGKERNLTLCSPGGSETAKMIRKIQKETSNAQPAAPDKAKTSAENASTASPGTRDNPVTATLVSSERLNALESSKDTRHVVIDLSQSQLKYKVGDALGIYPRNCEQLIEQVFLAANLQRSRKVTIEGRETTVFDALFDRCLRSITDELVTASIDHVRERPKFNGSVSADASLLERLQSFSDSDEFGEWDVLEFLNQFGNLSLTAQNFIDSLTPLRPRLYSIASSQTKFPTQVHLTVGRVEKELRGRHRKGVASTMLSDRSESGTSLKVFVHPSHGFTIPEDPNAPMIMVGPGTGIAPFLAFLQQREMDQANGKNWLFFGDQRKELDFLYQDILELWKHSGLLSRLDLAFSRDTAEKIYVQNRMLENGAELFSWLEQGAYFFVCGDASRMAVDVDKALQEIVAFHGSRSGKEAKEYIEQLTHSKRYVRDVY